VVDANNLVIGNSTISGAFSAQAITGALSTSPGTTITSNTATLMAGTSIGTLAAPFQTINTTSPTTPISVSAGVSINIVGTSSGNTLNFLTPAPGLVLFNGTNLLSTNANSVQSSNSPAQDAAFASLGQTSLVSNGDQLLQTPLNVADTVRDFLFSSYSPRLRMTAGDGVVGMLAPIFTIEGVGINVPADVAGAMDRQSAGDPRQMQ
jgi:hypothetical protein